MKETKCRWCHIPLDEKPVLDNCQEQIHWEAYSDRLLLERDNAISQLNLQNEWRKELLKDIRIIIKEELRIIIKEELIFNRWSSLQ